MINVDFKNIDELLIAFPNEQACLAHLEQLRWKDGPVSPFIIYSKVYCCRRNLYRCNTTNKYFNVKTGSVFASSKMPLQKWFVAIWLCAENPKLNSIELSHTLGITQKSAWYLLKRVKSVSSSYIAARKNVTVKNKNNQDGVISSENETLLMSDWLKRLKKEK